MVDIKDQSLKKYSYLVSFMSLPMRDQTLS